MENVIEAILTPLVAALMVGGPEMVAALLLFIIILLFDRRRILKQVEKNDARIDDMVEEYHSSMLAVVQTLESLRTMIYQIRIG